MKNSYRVCLFSDTVCDPNGVSRFIQDMARVSQKQDKELFVITSTSKKFCENLPNVFIIKPLVRIKMPYYETLDLVLPNYSKMMKLVKKLNPDMIHISTPGPVGLIGLIIARRLKLQIAGVYHTNFPEYMYSNTGSKTVRSISRFVMRQFYRKFSLVFTRSDEYIPELEEKIGIDRDKIKTIPHGIDIDKFTHEAKDHEIWHDLHNPNGVKILYVGRLTVEKNVQFLLEIWKELKKIDDEDIQDAELILLGEGALDKEAQQLKELKVFPLGLKRGLELAKYYASSDFFVFPSETDTLGQVVMEAMASGLGVIVSDVGGPQSLVDESRGFVLSCQDKEAWLQTSVKMIKDQTLRQKLGANGIEFMKDRSIYNTFEYFFAEQTKACILHYNEKK